MEQCILIGYTVFIFQYFNLKGGNQLIKWCKCYVKINQSVMYFKMLI